MRALCDAEPARSANGWRTHGAHAGRSVQGHRTCLGLLGWLPQGSQLAAITCIAPNSSPGMNTSVTVASRRHKGLALPLCLGWQGPFGPAHDHKPPGRPPDHQAKLGYSPSTNAFTRLDPSPQTARNVTRAQNTPIDADLAAGLQIRPVLISDRW